MLLVVIADKVHLKGSYRAEFKLKGQCHDVQWFFALFCASKKWRLLAQVSRTSDLKAWPSARPGSLATYAGCWHDSAVHEPTTSRARVALLHLSTATGSTFVFRLWGPSKVISPSLRIKISSDSYLYRFFIRVFGSARLPKLASTISSPRAWVTGRRTLQCGRT